MKTYFGNYLGLCISNKDPEQRGRVQIYVPHILPTLTGLSDKGQDIEIGALGSNIPGGLDSATIEKLMKILPWAEAASPIIGASAPGTLVSTGGEMYYDQSPTTNPAPGAASAYINDTPWSSAFISYIGNSTGAGFPAAGRHVDYASAVRNGAAPGWQALDPATTEVKPGDIVIQNRDGSNLTFNSKWDGNSHGDVVTDVSDGKITSIGGNVANTVGLKTKPAGSSKSDYFAIIRPSDPAVAQKMVDAAKAEQQKWAINGWSEQSPGALNTLGQYYAAGKLPVPAGAEKASESALPPAPNPLVTTTGKPDPNATTNPALSSSSVDTGTLTENELLFAMRIAAAESGAGVVSAKGVYNDVVDIEQRVAYAYGYGSGMKISELKAAGRRLIDSGAVDYNKIDLGYVQSNQYNNAGGAKNSGTYKEQIVGTAQYIRKLAAAKPQLGVLESIRSGNFARADAVLGSKNGGTTIGTKYYGLVDHPEKTLALLGRVSREFNGSASAALDAIDKELYPTPSITEITNNTFVPAVVPNTPNMVNNTFPHGRTVTHNTNDSAKGLFAYPGAGAMLWVFFREGNPLYPVYFAASYGAADWASAYRTSSPGHGYANNDDVISTGTHMNFGDVGIKTENTVVKSDPTQNQKSLMIYSDDGSNMFMGKGLHQIYTRHDRSDKVDQDRYEVTGGYKEEWVEGDFNKVVAGNSYVKVGIIDQEGVDAMQKISEYTKTIQEPLLKKSSGSSS